ncbi:MAG: hypothetical protein E7635_05530 [Ruminococcaceae bacterium]|nr:hypothetical protein [Oscillospiraceae bacterium]
MNNRLKHLISFILSFTIIISLFSINLFNAKALPLDEPLLYYNDSTWARENRAPLKIIENEYYVPLVIFAQLEGANVRVNNSLNTFVISNGDKYISFDATTDIATDQSNTYLYIRTYKLDYGERYIPAEIVCDHLGFEFEYFKNEITGAAAVRISDKSAELDFEELLEKHNPAILNLEKETTRAHTEEDTKPAVKPQQPSEIIIGNRILYLTVEAGVNEYTDGMLNTLAYYGYKATFFIDRSDITNYPLTIARLLSEGHNLGLRPDNESTQAYTDTESFIAELNSTNELLYRVFKIKTGAVRPDASAYNTLLISDIQSGKLAEAGYIVWNETVDRADAMMSNTEAIELLSKSIREKNTLVLTFGSNATTATVLSGTLKFIYEHGDKIDVRLAGPAYNPPR